MASRGLGALGSLLYPFHWRQWYSGGQVFIWHSKDKLGKCFTNRGLIRGDGKVFNSVLGVDTREIQCLPSHHYANINHSGYLDGITSDGVQFTARPISSITGI